MVCATASSHPGPSLSHRIVNAAAIERLIPAQQWTRIGAFGVPGTAEFKKMKHVPFRRRRTACQGLNNIIDAKAQVSFPMNAIRSLYHVFRRQQRHEMRGSMQADALGNG